MYSLVLLLEVRAFGFTDFQKQLLSQGPPLCMRATTTVPIRMTSFGRGSHTIIADCEYGIVCTQQNLLNISNALSYIMGKALSKKDSGCNGLEKMMDHWLHYRRMVIGLAMSDIMALNYSEWLAGLSKTPIFLYYRKMI